MARSSQHVLEEASTIYSFDVINCKTVFKAWPNYARLTLGMFKMMSQASSKSCKPLIMWRLGTLCSKPWRHMEATNSWITWVSPTTKSQRTFHGWRETAGTQFGSKNCAAAADSRPYVNMTHSCNRNRKPGFRCPVSQGSKSVMFVLQFVIMSDSSNPSINDRAHKRHRTLSYKPKW